MKVNIKGTQYDLHYSMRIYIIYENVVGTSATTADVNSMTSTVSLLYATLVSTLKNAKADTTLTFDDVIDIIDENGGMNFVNEFSQWFAECVDAQMKLVAKDDKPKKQNSKKK